MVSLAVMIVLMLITLLIPLTLIPHILSLFKWRDYPYFPGVRLKSALWGFGLFCLCIWQLVTRYDVLYNDRAWFGTLDDRADVDLVIMLLIFAAVSINTIVYWRIVRRHEPKDKR